MMHGCPLAWPWLALGLALSWPWLALGLAMAGPWPGPWLARFSSSQFQFRLVPVQTGSGSDRFGSSGSSSILSLPEESKTSTESKQSTDPTETVESAEFKFTWNP